MTTLEWVSSLQNRKNGKAQKRKKKADSDLFRGLSWFKLKPELQAVLPVVDSILRAVHRILSLVLAVLQSVIYISRDYRVGNGTYPILEMP
jgi:hypothetical protein